jgi:plastocyanin
MFIEDDGRDANIESSVLSPAQSFSRKFDTAGTYRYYCKIHPEMKGTVIVV